jgi:DNA-binding transcriptional ArsR family regulator
MAAGGRGGAVHGTVESATGSVMVGIVAVRHDRACMSLLAEVISRKRDSTMKILEKPDVLAALAALAHAVRLDVFRVLVQAGPEGVTPTALAALVEPGLKQSTLATHLKELVSAGLVVNVRAGRNVVYRADYDRMGGVVGYLTENCCAGAPCAVEPATAACGC